MGDHSRCLNHQTKRMAESVREDLEDITAEAVIESETTLYFQSSRARQQRE